MTNLITQHKSNRKLTLSSFPPAGANHPTTSDEAYTYDPVGNRLTDALARTYTYNNANELLTQNGTSFTYDNNGNITTKTDTSGTTLYQYDYENRLIKATMPSGTIAEYKYDPFGRRIEKKTTTGNKTKTTKYLYDREDILYEYDSAGAITTKYIHGPGIDEPLAMVKSGNLYYYHADGLGSITSITSSRARISQQYRYDSFGNITYMKDTRFTQPYTYTGREYDSETGMYYYRARYYDGKVGRFVSKDPIGFAGGDVNLYSYVSNNSINYIDPLGLIMAIYDGGSNKLTIFSNEGNYLGQYDASNLTTRDSKGEIPTGIYDLGEPRGPRGNTRSDTGNWFIPILNVPGRENIGLHGGGSGLDDPFAPRQGWTKTKGCTRTQNEDLENIVKLIQQDIIKNRSNRIIIIPKYPASGFGR